MAANSRRARDGRYLEQLGCLDPLPNAHGEKVAGLNLERLRYWLGCGAQLSRPAEKLLGRRGAGAGDGGQGWGPVRSRVSPRLTASHRAGLAGFLPLHPMTVTGAERLRRRRQREQQPEAAPADGSAEPGTAAGTAP